MVAAAAAAGVDAPPLMEMCCGVGQQSYAPDEERQLEFHLRLADGHFASMHLFI